MNCVGMSDTGLSCQKYNCLLVHEICGEHFEKAGNKTFGKNKEWQPSQFIVVGGSFEFAIRGLLWVLYIAKFAKGT